jgi:hypothetical protein
MSVVTPSAAVIGPSDQSVRRIFAIGRRCADSSKRLAGIGSGRSETKSSIQDASWLCSTTSRESDPNETMPQADAFVFGDEIAR